jgi:spore germination protein PE
MVRTVLAGCIKIFFISAGSVLQVGDTAEVLPSSQVFALQREFPRYDGKEGDLSRYPLYTQSFPAPEIREDVNWSVRNTDPFLRVRCIEITGISTSGIVHIGNTSAIRAEGRTKHIRHISPETAEAGDAADLTE